MQPVSGTHEFVAIMVKGEASLIHTYDRGEPAVSYKWTGWNSRPQENYR